MTSPTFAQIEPVGQCNLRCRMCAIQYRDAGTHGAPAFMDFALYSRLLDELPALRELQLQGLGEPMMHPRFFDMVRLASARGITVSTNSNLTLLDARRAGLLLESGLAWLHVSIDGATAATYEGIRVGAHLSRVTRNLARLLRLRRERGQETPRVRLVVVAMRRNLRELPTLVWMAHRLGVDTSATTSRRRRCRRAICPCATSSSRKR
jgi:MoaA/NifB/PqqE/SkfB family radical SAM enzyme